MLRSFGYLCGLAALAIAAVPCAHASLGGDAASVAKDAQALHSKTSNTAAAESYTVQEIVSAGTTIREFISSSGVVFAIAWKGMHHPLQLHQLLGSYSPEFDTAFKADAKINRLHQGRRGRNLKTDDLVVQFEGHQRQMWGRAYVPSLLPQGVSDAEIH